MDATEYIGKSRLAEGIYRGLTSDRFSRHRPREANKVGCAISEPIFGDGKLYLMGLWGGSKEGTYGDDADERSLDFLSGIQGWLRKEYPPSQVSLLFCDSHHVLVNGKEMEECTGYYEKLNPMALERELKMTRLSDMLPDVSMESYTDRNVRIKAREIMENADASGELRKSANKHSCLTPKYDSEEIARLYVEVELYFLAHAMERFPGSVFFSFSDPVMQEPIAEAAGVPMLYFHAAGKGHHASPWYSGYR